MSERVARTGSASEQRVALWSTCVAIGLILAILLGTGYFWARQTYLDHLLREAINLGNLSHPPGGWWEDALQACRLGANPNLTSREGVSPLMLAAGSGSLNDVALLIRRGANVNWSSKGSTVLMSAADTRIADYLEKHGADPLAGDHADGIGWISNLPMMEWWLQRLPTANLRGEGETTPLMYAARACRPDCVEVLLRYGADPKLRDRRGRTAADLIRRLLSYPRGNYGLERRHRWKTIIQTLERKNPSHPSAPQSNHPSTRAVQ